ncbi:putative amidoligase enzyme-domain-containing protein [Xylariaceae sp. FL1019]|nr:putative amidoligase enzyme-domain-containing protein [Xylariaceae sp. FL1019]
MANSKLPLPDRSTFGVEIELVVPTLPENRADPINHEVPVLRIPPDVFDPEEYVIDQVQACLDKYLPYPDKSIPFLAPTQSPMDYYRHWRAVADTSIRGPPLPYDCYGVEINSSVELSCPEAFDVVQYAVSCLTQEFRCFVNHSCGLHVHTGCRDELLSVDQMKRMASLIFAVEPLVFSLHDPTRTISPYCQPLQDVSRLAKRKKGDDVGPWHVGHEACANLTGLGRRHGEAEMYTRRKLIGESGQRDFLATREQGRYDPFVKSANTPNRFIFSPWLSDINSQIDLAVAHCRAAITEIQEARLPSTRTRTRTIPPLQRSQLDESESRALIATMQDVLDNSWRAKDEKTDTPANVILSADEIYSQPCTCRISWLLQTEHTSRLAIAFHNYACYPLISVDIDKRTIEWRLAEPSLDGEWIATWAKICVGVFEFALYASPIDFIEVIDQSHRASKGEISYDIIDLLDDIGLFAEAVVVENRLKANKERLRVRFAE